MTRSYSSLLSWFGLTLAASLMLYHTSDRVTALSRQLHDVNTQIEAEQQSIHILKAEWVYLANPERVEAEAKRHLNMQAALPSHVVSMSPAMIASLAPLRPGVEPAPQPEVAEAEVHDVSVPIAKIQSESSSSAARSMHERVFASINSGHINDHVLLQHGVVSQASTDTIGTLINSLSLRP